MAVDLDIAGVNSVINDFFEGDKAPRGTVNESTLRQTIASILTRSDAAYVPVTALYDTGEVTVVTSVVGEEGAIAVTANALFVPETTPGAGDQIAPIAGIIDITDYNCEETYVVSIGTPIVAESLVNAENVLIEGDFDKLSVHYQNGSITVSGKITENIVGRKVVVRLSNAYYDSIDTELILNVSLPE